MPTVEERTTRAGRVSTGGTSTDAPYDRVFVHDLVLDAEIGVYTHEKGVTQRARIVAFLDSDIRAGAEGIAFSLLRTAPVLFAPRPPGRG